jgi:hypothetical protein
LTEGGIRVLLFDKGRRPGGRCASRGTAPQTVDHGAQYFTLRDASLQSTLSEWLSVGLVATWSARLVLLEAPISTSPPRPAGQNDQRYVAVPDMNALPRHLAEGLEILLETRIARLEHLGAAGWRLWDSDGRQFGPFAALILALPAPQAADLLNGHGPLEQTARAHPMTPCWAAWCQFQERPATLAGFDGAFVSTGPLAWIASQASKPGRSSESWMLHANSRWSQANLELAPDAAALQLFTALEALIGDLPTPLELRAHRWGFAAPAAGPVVDDRILDLAPCDPERRLVLAGDSYAQGRVEGALLSGRAAADSLSPLLAPRPPGC